MICLFGRGRRCSSRLSLQRKLAGWDLTYNLLLPLYKSQLCFFTTVCRNEGGGCRFWRIRGHLRLAEPFCPHREQQQERVCECGCGATFGGVVWGWSTLIHNVCKQMLNIYDSRECMAGLRRRDLSFLGLLVCFRGRFYTQSH